MEHFEYIILGFIIGIVFAGLFKIDIHISKKEDFRAKTKELDNLIKKMAEDVDKPAYRKDELFPPDLPRDYGMPKDLE